jgi:hypothetical protein
MFGFIGAAVLLVSWIPVTMVLFALMPARRAVFASAIAAWLFLPPDAVISIPGLPDYDKTMAVGASLLLSILIFEPGRLLLFRFRWFDVPMVVFCLCPFFSSISNDLGAYDGAASAFKQCLVWGVPYWVGRVYLTDTASFREFGLAMIIGTICLVPLFLFEIKMSPMLQPILYGFGSSRGSFTSRYGGYRPEIFFSTSLECGLWMNAVALVAFWFWRRGVVTHLWAIPAGLIFGLLSVIAVLCKTFGATSIVLAGGMSLVISVQTKTKWLMWSLLFFAPLFCTLRTTELWSGRSIVQFLEMIGRGDRADSLDFRFENDDMLIAKAMQRPLFGWGGWGRSRVYDEFGGCLTTMDAYWTIILGQYGCIGLVSVTLMMLLPAILFLKRFPIEQWKLQSLAPVVVIATIVDLFMLDCLANAMPNMIYFMAAGGLFNIVPARIRSKSSDDEGNRARALSSWETLAAQYRVRGREAKDRGQIDEAKTAWLHALELYAKLTAAGSRRPETCRQWCDCANDLAWLLVTAADPISNDPALAVALATKTTEMYPECSTYWNTLGAGYYRSRDFQAARAALDRSMTLGDEGTAFDQILLAMSCAQLGDQQQAHRQFADAIRLMEEHLPDHPELSRLRAEAQSLLDVGPAIPASID